MAEGFGAYRGRRALVTGGLGFIGSNLAHRLVELGAQVTIIDSLAANCGGNMFNLAGIEEAVAIHQADMADPSAATQVVADAEVIFNLAGTGSHVDSMEDPSLDLDLNCRAHVSLLEACRKSGNYPLVVRTSTRQVYGKPVYLPVDELHPVAPCDINAIHELANEQYHSLYHQVYGVPTVCLRLTNTYGPRQLIRHPRQSFIAWFIRQALEGAEIELFGDGSQLRDLNYVDDVVEALLRAGTYDAEKPEIFNLGADAPISLREIGEELLALAGRGSVRTVPFPPERQRIEIGSIYSSYTKIGNELGWRPRTSLRAGLERTLTFYEKHRERYVLSDASPVPRPSSRVPRS